MIVGGSRCALADGECRGMLEWHHVLTKNRLKREFKYGARFKPTIPPPPSAANILVGQWEPALRYEPVTRDDYWSRSLDSILGDTRNRVWLCSHHHELVTNGRLEVELPESVWEFADEFGLRAQLENDLARRAA